MVRVDEAHVTALRESAEFDAEWYLSRYPDVSKTGLGPEEHYLRIGWLLRRNPSSSFDTNFYLNEYRDVAAAGINPLAHYLLAGRFEGRHPSPLPSIVPTASDGIILREARYRVDRNAIIGRSEDWLIFVAYSADGTLSRCQRFQIETFSQAGYSVALIVNSDRFADMVAIPENAARIIIVRENLGFDFGAWRHAVEILGGLSNAQSVAFTNDSIMPTAGGAELLSNLRARISCGSADAVFMTGNREVRPHLQSYFFAFTAAALKRGALSHLADVPSYADKDRLIQAVELLFAERLSASGHEVDCLFNLDVEENPTIHHWEALLGLGFPFVKVQLITAGILQIDDPRLVNCLGVTPHELLKEHCQKRGAGPSNIALPGMGGPTPAIANIVHFNEYGAQQATNPCPALWPTIKVPLAGQLDTKEPAPKILAVIHGFYLDVLAQILDQIAGLDIEMRLIVTTDTPEKLEVANGLIAARSLRGEAVLCQNRGRDVAPFLVEGAKHLDDCEVILHLHTKKSPHDSVYAGWGEFLRKNLIGSREVVLSILKILQEAPVGIVFSDHFPAVVNLRNWGFDFDHAQSLLARVGCHIDGSMPLEFPTSTMFWARREALAPLFDLGLDYQDFEEEAGQIDGTLAHAIERSLLYVVEHGGLGHAKVSTLAEPTDPRSRMLELHADSVTYAIDRPTPQLNGGMNLRSAFYDSVPEIYPVGVARSRSNRRRLNAILPTMKPEKIYGGITTALAVIKQLADNMGGDVDLRVLITSDSVDSPSVQALCSRLDRSFTHVGPSDDSAGNVIVGVAQAQNDPISVRAGDMYVSTAWWTADLGFRLIDQQRTMFGAEPLMTYIIQDYEPGFYSWSNHYALAEATYCRPDSTIAIINSEELAGYMDSRYDFLHKQYVPYQLHPRLKQLIAPTCPQKLIIAYGRPSVSRNCFELLLEGFRVWQSRNPRQNCEYEIVFAGEEFDQGLIASLENARNVGKMSIEDYADMLNRACIGVSLMVSPHPSYPPLEMASAGCVTVTNGYDGKDLILRSEQIISVKSLTPAALADGIEAAVKRIDFAVAKPIQEIRHLPSQLATVDYRAVAQLMLSRAAA